MSGQIQGVPHLPSTATPDDVARTLRQHGCVIIDSLVEGVHFDEVRDALAKVMADASLGQNGFDGYSTKRVYDPFARTRVLDPLLTHPLVTGAVEAIVGQTQFGMTVLSDIQPGEVAQFLHRDVAVYHIPIESDPVMVNTIWAMDDFTAENGATVVVPGSHVNPVPVRDRAFDPDVLVSATMSAGSVLFYDGRLVHGGGQSTATSGGRLGLIVEHVVRWLRPGDNHTVTVPRDVAAQLSVQMQELLGWNQNGEYFGFVAGQPPGDWLKESAT